MGQGFLESRSVSQGKMTPWGAREGRPFGFTITRDVVGAGPAPATR